MKNQRLFKNKYRTKTLRLKNWDYSGRGNYFVTICTKDQYPFFGKVRDGEVVLNEAGKIVAEEWRKTEKIRENVLLDEWVVMPNHIHGIIRILYDRGDSVETPRRGVSTAPRKQWRPGVLGAIINQIKSVSTKRIRRELGFHGFFWQSRYYEHIIRSGKSLEKIREYIKSNPANWQKDEYYL